MAEATGGGLAVRAFATVAVAIGVTALVAALVSDYDSTAASALPLSIGLTALVSPLVIAIIITMSWRRRFREREPSVPHRLGIAARAWGWAAGVGGVFVVIFFGMAGGAVGAASGAMLALGVLVVPMFAAGFVASLVVEGIAKGWRELTLERPIRDSR